MKQPITQALTARDRNREDVAILYCETEEQQINGRVHQIRINPGKIEKKNLQPKPRNSFVKQKPVKPNSRTFHESYVAETRFAAGN